MVFQNCFRSLRPLIACGANDVDSRFDNDAAIVIEYQFGILNVNFLVLSRILNKGRSISHLVNESLLT